MQFKNIKISKSTPIKDNYESIYLIFDNYRQIENKYKLPYKDMANIWYFMENHMAIQEKTFQKAVRKGVEE